jgi:hypothetical protein
MHLNPENRHPRPPIWGKTREIVVDDVSLGRFLASTSLVATMSAPFGLPRETIMDINNDDRKRKDVQPYPVEPGPESRGRGEGNSPLSRRGGSLGH